MSVSGVLVVYPVIHNQEHGQVKEYYENGKLKLRGNYKEDKKEGKWEYFDEEGNLTGTEKYKNDDLVE